MVDDLERDPSDQNLYKLFKSCVSNPYLSPDVHTVRQTLRSWFNDIEANLVPISTLFGAAATLRSQSTPPRPFAGHFSTSVPASLS